MFSNDVVHMLNQPKAFESQMRGSLLKVTNAEELILVNVLSRIIMNMLHQQGGDITPVVGNRFAIK